jgi:hypothetical protein
MGSGGPGGDGGKGGFGAGGGAGGAGGFGEFGQANPGAGGGHGPGGFAGNGSTTDAGAGSGLGGAIFNQGGTVTITNSTITLNTASGGNANGTGQHGGGYGGGIYNLNGQVIIQNSTIAGNTLTDGTGGASGPAFPTDGSELFNASVNVGADTATQAAVITIVNSIFSHPAASGDAIVNDLDSASTGGSATINATGPNIRFGNLSSTGTLSGTPFTLANPGLGALADNGGPTQTLALAAGSPAINAGDNAAVTVAGLTFDQRGSGFVRISSGTVDLGAFEVQAPVQNPLPLAVSGLADGSAVVLNPTTGGLFNTTPATTLSPFGKISGDVRVATADVTGDGTPDYIVGTGPGVPNRIAVVDVKTNTIVATFAPFEATFTGGVLVAASDLDGDGKAEAVVTPDQGSGPVVAIYSGAKLAAGLTGDAAQFTRFDDPNFRGGARPAFGDLKGDGRPDLVLAAGFGGGPRIAIFNGASVLTPPPAGQLPPKLVGDFFAFESSLRNGAFVSAGDVNGDGHADIAFGGGPGGGPRVRLFDGAKLLAAGTFQTLDNIATAAQMANFFAGDQALRGGVRTELRAVTGIDADELVVGSGEGEHSLVRVFLPANLLANSNPLPDQIIDPFNQSMPDGIFVG